MILWCVLERQGTPRPVGQYGRYASPTGTATESERTVTNDRHGTPKRPRLGTGRCTKTRLGHEILPYPRELDGHDRTAEERETLWRAERVQGP